MFPSMLAPRRGESTSRPKLCLTTCPFPPSLLPTTALQETWRRLDRVAFTASNPDNHTFILSHAEDGRLTDSKAESLAATSVHLNSLSPNCQQKDHLEERLYRIHSLLKP